MEGNTLYDSEQLAQMFARASTLKAPIKKQVVFRKDEYKTESEWRKLENEARRANESSELEFQQERKWNGVKQFKRRVLGFCGNSSVKSIDELADVVQSLKIADSRNEAIALVSALPEKDLRYGRYDIIRLTKVRNAGGNPGYKVERIFDAETYYKDHPPIQATSHPGHSGSMEFMEFLG